MKKETQARVLSCEVSEVFKDNYFVVHLRTAASGIRKIPIRHHSYLKFRTLSNLIRDY